MIPKIIHYCWLSSDPIPEKLQKCMESWKKNLSDYEFMLWDLKRFDINQTIWTKQAFNAKKYAFAADYIRLYAVYTYGGIYMDMDVEVVKSFNSLLRQDYILGYEKVEGIEAGVFGSIPRSIWLQKCINYYNNRPFIKNDGSFDMMPLPNIMYKILKEENLLDTELSLLPPDYLTAKSYKTGKISITSNTYCIHHFAGSWITSKQKLYKLVSHVLGTSFAHLCSVIYNFVIRKCR